MQTSFALPFELCEVHLRRMGGPRPGTLREAYALRRPAFIKSPKGKGIRALVYADGSWLPGPEQLDPYTPVLVSDVVEFTAEYRLHVLDGKVHTGSQYAEHGKLHL